MEENLMEKLLNDFNGTLNEFNELVNKNDFEGVQRVLEEVNRLIQERNGIVLDDREPQYDHVLHELLDKMHGIVEREITVQGIDGVSGTRYYTNAQVEEMIAEAEEQLKEITRMVETYKDVNDEAYAQARSDRSAIIARIADLRASLVEGQEFSTLTYIDSRLAELQQERARLVREKEENLKEIDRLKAEETPDIPGNPANQTRIDEIDARLSELENIFSNLEGQINAIREMNISQLIDNLRSQINGINQNENDIAFLETLLPEIEQRQNLLQPMDFTYMGRLSDEQIIRRLLSQQLNLNEEEINSTIGEYSLVQAEAGAHDEYGEDNPISMRQLVRTRRVKGDITVGEAIDSLEAQLYDGPVVDHTQEIAEINARIEELDRLNEENADIEARIAELNEQERRNQEELNEYRDTLEFFESLKDKDREDYNQAIANLEAKNREIAEAKRRIREGRSASAKEEKEALLARKKELEQDSLRKENPEVRERINRLKEISGIADLEKQLQQYRDEYAKLQQEKESLVPTPGKPGIDNSEKIAALEARNREIDKRIAEIDKEIEGIPGAVPPRKETEKLDVGKEAHRIGDHIFKTATIRRELAARNVSRDEFLAFYQAGLDKTNEQIEQLSQEYRKYLEEIKTVLTNPENPNTRIDKQILEAEQEGNKELATKLYEQMRKNFIATGRKEQLKDMGLDHEITNPEDVEKMKMFFATYRESTKEGYSRIKSSIKELKENATIFSTEIARINDEKATLEIAGASIEELENKTEARKDLRRKLLEASITPEKELTEEQKELLESWQKASERFLSQKTTAQYIYIGKDGTEQVIDVDSIYDGYPEYATDIEFLGVPAYKENLEQISAWKQTKDPYVFGVDAGMAFEAAEAERQGAGQEVIDSIIADKQKYVETFNGIPNPHKVKYENWKTAGSTLKGMKPVSRDLPMQSRAKNVAENVFRFLGIRAPKFTRLDEHGNEVKDIKGGIATLAMDGLVVGAVVGSAVTLGPAIALSGYAAKGIVTAGNRIAARVEYARHKDEIDSNKPVLNQADRNAREVARKEYYREQGDNRFVSWVKAKSDKYFTRKREKETEKAIVDKLANEYSESEGRRAEALKENIEIANANQEARLRRQAQIAMGANTYNDIVRDPDAVDMNAATAAIARNAALEASKPGAGIEDVNKASTAARKAQYVKQEKPVDKTADLNEDAFQEQAATIPVSAVTAEQIYTGRKQHVDRLNRVLTLITAAGIKFGFTAWKDGLTENDIIHHEAETEDYTIHHDAETEDYTIHHEAETEDYIKHHDAVTEDYIIHHEAEYKQVEVPDYETQFDTNQTLEALRKNYAGKTADQYYSVSGGLRGQRTEALVNEEITAAWFDNNTTWRTGISDTQGLTAPVLTDRLVDAGLLDANGMLRQDITVQQLLDAMGCSNADLESLDGIYMSVGDKYWVRLSDLMEGMTHEVPVGSHFEPQLVKEAWDETATRVIKEAWDEPATRVVKEAWDEPATRVVKEAWDETVTKIDPGLIGKAIADGAIIGTGIGLADNLHEAVQTTYIDGTIPGRPEEVTPQAADSFDKIADKLFEQAEKEAAKKTQPEPEEKDER